MPGLSLTPPENVYKKPRTFLHMWVNIPYSRLYVSYQLLSCLQFLQKTPKCMYDIHYSPALTRCSLLKLTLTKDKTIFLVHSRCRSCCRICTCDARNQGICWQGKAFVCPEYSGISTRRVKLHSRNALLNEKQHIFIRFMWKLHKDILLHPLLFLEDVGFLIIRKSL